MQGQICPLYAVVYPPPTVTLCPSCTMKQPRFFFFSFWRVLVIVSGKVWFSLAGPAQTSTHPPTFAPPARSKHLYYPAVRGAQLPEPTVHLPFMIVINGQIIGWMIFRSNKQKETICVFLQQRDTWRQITSSPGCFLLSLRTHAELWELTCLHSEIE